MKINSEGIFGTRPWGIYGEGPSELPRSNLNDLKSPMTSRDIRFTTKGNVLYAFVLGWPRDHKVTIRSLAKPAGTIVSINLLGCPGKLDWKQTDKALEINLPSKKPCDHAITFKITGTKSEKLTPAPGSSIGVPSPSGR
jgi:alpha-L-fucosidase